MKQPGGIRQPWLTVTRAVWLLLAAYHALPGLLGAPEYFRQLVALEPWPNTTGWTHTTFSAATAQSGITSHMVAWLILLPTLLKALVFLGTGLLIFWRKSDEWLGLLASFVLVGLCGTFFGNRFQFVDTLPPFWYVVARELGGSLWLGFYMFLLIFPDGRFAPGWTKWLSIFLVAWFVAIEVSYFVLGYTPDWISWSGFPVILLTLVGQVQRYRRFSSRVERQQMRWFLMATAIFFTFASLQILMVSIFPLPPQPGARDLYVYLGVNLLSDLVFLAFPISIGMAIFRYHLWDIDLVIRRTLQYGLLTGLLGGLYFGLVIGLEACFRAITGQESPLALVLSTLAIFIVFTPLRRRVQAFIDRRFYRRKYNAEKALQEFAAVVAYETDLVQLTKRLADTSQEALQPEQISLWLKSVPMRGSDANQA